MSKAGADYAHAVFDEIQISALDAARCACLLRNIYLLAPEEPKKRKIHIGSSSVTIS